MTSLPRSATRAECGFVLVAVLWILTALATLASIYSSYTVNTAAASRVADDRVQAEASIRAGVEMAVFSQLALPEKARLVRGGFDMRVGRTGVAVRFRSEGARIDLNAASSDLLTGLFIAVGVDPMRAETFAERAVGWRTKATAGAGANAESDGANATGPSANAAGADREQGRQGGQAL
jgi:general secretion pathway protein K